MKNNIVKKPLPWLRLLVLAAGVVALDRITKKIIVGSMALGDSRSVIGEFFHLTFVQNPGGAFGTRLGGNLFYIIAALFAISILVMWLLQRQHLPFGLTGIALMLGGAAGNLWDRATIGVVIDFLDFGIGKTRWPTFNIADSAITVGITLLILQEILSIRKQRKDVPVQGRNEDDCNP